MLEVTILVILATSAWAAFDSRSHRISIDGKPYTLNNGALAWFLTCALLWIFGFPFYLYKRARTPRSSTPSTTGGNAFCTSCGHPLAPGNRFCTCCGRALPAPPQVAPAPAPKTNPSVAKALLVVVLGLGLPVAAAYLLWTLGVFSGNHDAPSPTPAVASPAPAATPASSIAVTPSSETSPPHFQPHQVAVEDASALLRQGWRFPTETDVAADVNWAGHGEHMNAWADYRQEFPKPYHARADFDDDGTPDDAWLLVDQSGRWGLFALLKGDRVVFEVDESGNEDNVPVQRVGLRAVDATDYRTPDSSRGAAPGLGAFLFETDQRWVYYWNAALNTFQEGSLDSSPAATAAGAAALTGATPSTPRRDVQRPHQARREDAQGREQRAVSPERRAQVEREVALIDRDLARERQDIEQTRQRLAEETRRYEEMVASYRQRLPSEPWNTSYIKGETDSFNDTKASRERYIHEREQEVAALEARKAALVRQPQ